MSQSVAQRLAASKGTGLRINPRRAQAIAEQQEIESGLINLRKRPDTSENKARILMQEAKLRDLGKIIDPILQSSLGAPSGLVPAEVREPRTLRATPDLLVKKSTLDRPGTIPAGTSVTTPKGQQTKLKTDAAKIQSDLDAVESQLEDLLTPTPGTGQTFEKQISEDVDKLRQFLELQREQAQKQREINAIRQQEEDIKARGQPGQSQFGTETPPGEAETKEEGFGTSLIDIGAIPEEIASFFDPSRDLILKREAGALETKQDALNSAARTRADALTMLKEGKNDAIDIYKERTNLADILKVEQVERENEAQRRELARIELDKLNHTVESARAEQLIRDRNLQEEAQNQRLSAKLGFGFDTSGIAWMQDQSRKSNDSLVYAIQKASIGNIMLSNQVETVIQNHRLGMLKADNDQTIRYSEAYKGYKDEVSSIRKDFYATEKEALEAETAANKSYNDTLNTLYKEHGDLYKEQATLTRSEIFKAEVENRTRQEKLISDYQWTIENFGNLAPDRIDALKVQANRLGLNTDLFVNKASLQQIEDMKKKQDDNIYGLLKDKFIDEETDHDYGKILFDSMRNMSKDERSVVLPEAMDIIGSRQKDRVFQAIRKNVRNSVRATEQTDIDSFEDYISETRGIIDFVSEKADSFGGRWEKAIDDGATWVSFEKAGFRINEEAVQMRAHIEVFQSDVRRQKFGTALTGTELESAGNFLIDFNKDTVKQIKTKMKELKDFYIRKRERKYDRILGDGIYNFLTGDGFGKQTTQFDEEEEFDSVEDQESNLEDLWNNNLKEPVTYRMESDTFDGRRVTLDRIAMDSFKKANKEFKKVHGRDLTIGAVASSSFRQDQRQVIKSMARDAGIQYNSKNPNETADQLNKLGRAVAHVGQSMHEYGLAVDMFPGDIQIGGKKFSGKEYAMLVKPFLERHGFRQMTHGKGDFVNFEFIS